MYLDLSIVTVSTNQAFLIKKCLKSLFDINWGVKFEIVLVDNACTDGTFEWVYENYPQVKIVRNEIRQGYPANGNKGICEQQNGRYVLMLNPDIECLPGLLDSLVSFMDKNVDVGIAGPMLLNPDRTIQPSCRRFSTPLAILIRGLHLDGIFHNSNVISSYLMRDVDHKSIVDVDWVTGALVIIRREALKQVGLMDENYFLYSDDQDWCCRMWNNGWRVSYVKEAQAVHAHLREGIRKPWSKAARHQLISSIRMFNKFGWRLLRTR